MQHYLFLAVLPVLLAALVVVIATPHYHRMVVVWMVLGLILVATTGAAITHPQPYRQPECKHLSRAQQARWAHCQHHESEGGRPLWLSINAPD